MRLQEYKEARARATKARSELEALVKPRLTDTRLISNLHTATLRHYDVDELSGEYRERFVTAVMLLYSPLSIYEKKPSARNLNSAVGRVLGISNSSVSQIVSAGRFTYHNVGSERRSVDELFDHLFYS